MNNITLKNRKKHRRYNKRFAVLKNNNQGMTMVEVLMGFVLLVLMLGMLSGIIALSSRMFERSVDLKRAEESLQQAVYKTTVTGSPVSEETLPLTLEPDATMPGDHDQLSLSAKLYKLTTADVLDGAEEESLNMDFYYFRSESPAGE
ncbi:MAG: hypothetical protein PUK75_08315 [bacterium]|nr:hypothetical protein [bacterium]MDY4101058.1 hypothetical protein [Lachnospiraceae bacterium]